SSGGAPGGGPGNERGRAAAREGGYELAAPVPGDGVSPPRGEGSRANGVRQGESRWESGLDRSADLRPSAPGGGDAARSEMRRSLPCLHRRAPEASHGTFAATASSTITFHASYHVTRGHGSRRTNRCAARARTRPLAGARRDG